MRAGLTVVTIATLAIACDGGNRGIGPSTTGALLVSVTTTGADHDADGYAVTVGTAQPRAVGAAGTVVIPELPTGDHHVELSGVAANCTVTAANPRLVTISRGDTTQVAFRVTCVALTGSVQVRAATSGVDLDLNGYAVRLDDGVPQPLAANGATTYDGLRAGAHAVLLSDLAGNCTVLGDNPATVSVTTGGATRDTARTTFAVTCVSTAITIEVGVTTSGAELDPNGYSLLVESCDSHGLCRSVRQQTVAVNGFVTIASAEAGDYRVGLHDVAQNCSVGGVNPRSTTVPPSDTARLAFVVTCVQTGSLQITVTTAGIDQDPDGYFATLDGGSVIRGEGLPVNGTVTVTGLPPRDYRVTVDALAANCDPASLNPVTITVPSGGTVAVVFDVACVAARQLALVLAGDVYVVKTNGAGFTQLTTHAASDGEPAWSPDGSRIAFFSDRDGNGEIYIMSADGSSQGRLTNNAAYDGRPAWSPDGTRIAFVSDRDGNAEIYVMNVDGSSPLRVTDHPASDGDPSWSPDGTKITFTSYRDGNAEIYVMNADGSGSTRLTSNGVDDVQPDWSPDGRRLVFSRQTLCDYGFCDYDLFLMNPDGSGATQLTSASSDPGSDWSPDGLWIAFVTTYCHDFYCYEKLQTVEVVRVDGTRLQAIAYALDPAWRP